MTPSVSQDIFFVYIIFCSIRTKDLIVMFLSLLDILAKFLRNHYSTHYMISALKIYNSRPELSYVVNLVDL